MTMRLRRTRDPVFRPAVRNNRHIACVPEHERLPGLLSVELTPKPLARTSRIMTGLLTPPRYARVVYLTAAAAESVVARAVAMLPPEEQARLTVRKLPRSALTWQV